MTTANRVVSFCVHWGVAEWGLVFFVAHCHESATEDGSDEVVDRALALGLKLRPEYLDQVIEDIKKEQNFFEGRVTEYRSGSTLSWD